MKNALLKLHIAVFLWGFTGVLGRLISLNEGVLVWYRLVITLLLLLLLSRFSSAYRHILVCRNHKLSLLGTGAVIGLHWLFFYGSIKYSNVSIALTCLSSSGLFTALLEPVINRKRVVLVEVLLGLLCIAGIYLIFHFNSQYKTGIILGLICTVLSCVFSIFNKQQVDHVPPKTLMFYELLGGLILVTAVLPFYYLRFPNMQLLPSNSDLLWLFFLAGFCTILAIDLSLQALKHISAFTQNLTLNLEPVYGVVLAFIVYKENKYLSTGFYAGFVLVLSAVLLQTVLVVRKSRLSAAAQRA